MAFKKGESGNPKGKLPGQINKTTAEFKEALNNLLEKSAPKMLSWLDSIAESDPSKALSHLEKLAEYVYPKLARIESDTRLSGELALRTLNINPVKPNGA